VRYRLDEMKPEQAEQISKWKYETEYSIYSMDESEELLNELLDGSYFSVRDNDNLIGYFCFGKAAQIPVKVATEFYLDSSFTDIGLGVKPALCGKGLGQEFLLSGMEFAREKLGAKKFRLTVASFNKRAIKVYERVGFFKVGSFIRGTDDVKFDVMQYG